MPLEAETEESLRRYVLGTLEEDPRLRLEERLVRDPDTFEALGVIEDELTEEYLDGTLTEPERRAYERHRSISPDRHRAPSFFSALRARASAPAAEPQRADSWDPGAWFRTALLQPAWLGAAAALLVASLAGNAWFALAPGSSDETAAPTPAVLVAKAPPETPAGHRPTTAGTPRALLGQRPGTLVPTFTLAAGLLRGGGSLDRIAVPPDARVVRLTLDLPGDDYPLYRATLHDVDGDELWAQSKIKAESTEEQIVLSLLVPTPLMPYGDYQLKVSGIAEEGEPEGVASYTFRVIRP